MVSKCCDCLIKKDNEFAYCSSCLKPVKLQKRIIHTVLVLSISLGLTLFSLSALAPGCLIRPSVEVAPTDVPLNDSALVTYMQEIGILFPEIVLQQIHWESGHFKSKICRENHNLLGIKYIKQKEAIGENRGHAMYPSFKACLRDYKRLQKYYLGNLGRRYAEDSTYIEKITKVNKKR